MLGDLIATNLFMLGFAWQRGLVPLSRQQAIERAIEINGTATEANKAAFAVGALRRGSICGCASAARFRSFGTPA